MPDRISVAVKAGRGSGRAGPEPAVTVNGRYLFGAPGADLPVEAKVRLVKAPFTPKATPTTSSATRSAASRTRKSSRKPATSTPRAWPVSRPACPRPLAPGGPGGHLHRPGARGRRRGVTGWRACRSTVYAAYPGLKRLASDAATPGKPMRFDYMVVAPDGKLVDTAELSATLYRGRLADGAAQKTRTARLPTNPCATPRCGKPGRLRPRAARATPIHRAHLRQLPAGPFGPGKPAPPPNWNSTPAASAIRPWAVENPARLELKPDKAEYALGRDRPLQVRAPFAGKLLVTVEGSGVHDVQVVPLAGNTGRDRHSGQARIHAGST